MSIFFKFHFSSSDVNISPLMTVGKKFRTTPNKPPRPKAAISKLHAFASRKVLKELLDSDSSLSQQESPDRANYDPGVVSPKSYLSMPSVKSFPRLVNA